MKESLPSGRALWGLFWRSIVFFPLGLVLSIAWLAKFLLPLAGIVFVLSKQWIYAVIAFAVWAPIAFLFRWKRLADDPKDWPNDQENI
jgi:hypothetical protein